MTPEADNQRCRQDLLGSLECDLALKRRFTAQLAEFLSATEREVESRLNSELKDPGESVAEAWLAQNPDPRIRDIRLDVILVAPGRVPRHIQAAFDASR